jgi:hypothetical protein
MMECTQNVKRYLAQEAHAEPQAEVHRKMQPNVNRLC